MSTTGQQPATAPIPVQLSESECTAFIGLDHGIGHFASMSLQTTQRLDIAKG